MNRESIGKKQMLLRRGLLALLTLGWMAMIFAFSAQSGDESGGLSALLAQPLTDALIDEADTTGDAELLYRSVDGLVRTVAHFAEYAVLGGLLSLLLRSFGVTALAWPWAAGTLYALTDEWHQFYVPGRAVQWTDVVIDSAGVLAGAILTRMMIAYWRKKHVHHS